MPFPMFIAYGIIAATGDIIQYRDADSVLVPLFYLPSLSTIFVQNIINGPSIILRFNHLHRHQDTYRRRRSQFHTAKEVKTELFKFFPTPLNPISYA
jgi:hypothetical protein